MADDVSMSTFRRLALFVLPFLCPTWVLAQRADGRFSIEDVLNAPFASSLSASPQGDAVVWLLNEQGRRNIWAANGPAWAGHRLTQFDSDDGQEIEAI